MDAIPELNNVVAVEPDQNLPEPDPFKCDICGEDVKVGEQFFEVFTLADPIVIQGGYFRKEPHKAWARDSSYIHLRHVSLNG